jgi:hypothetical protein
MLYDIYITEYIRVSGQMLAILEIYWKIERFFLNISEIHPYIQWAKLENDV